MEQLFDERLDRVSIHVDDEPTALGALAFARGEEIHVRPEHYRPESAAGWRLLGHELAHVLQQRHGRVGSTRRAAARVVHDAALEAEAERFGAAAQTIFETGSVPADVPVLESPRRASRPTFALQCLLSVQEFKDSTVASGSRNKVATVDSGLTEFHRLNNIQPRNYTAILTQIRALHRACQTYLRERPVSDRRNGVNILMRQIALEEAVLVALAGFGTAGSDLERWDRLEEAQETHIQLDGRDGYNRNTHAEIEALIQELRNRLANTPTSDAIIQKDFNELVRIGGLDATPEILRRNIAETTAPALRAKIKLGNLYSSGAKYNTNPGLNPKYTVNHSTTQILGKKERLASMLHELTHVSVAETFGFTPILLSIAPTATDAQILEVAGTRKANCLLLEDMIGADATLPEKLKSLLLNKAHYPICGKLVGSYLANFQAQLGADYARLSALATRGLDCELIEYDSVLNQMALLCHLWRVDAANAVYMQILNWAQYAYNRRSNYRNAALRPVVPPRGPGAVVLADRLAAI